MEKLLEPGLEWTECLEWTEQITIQALEERLMLPALGESTEIRLENGPDFAGNVSLIHHRED